MRPSDFSAHAFEWVRERISFDQGFIITSRKSDPTWLNAHFFGVADPRAHMESHFKVRHLDLLSQDMLSNVSCAHQIDVEDPRLAQPYFAPFREHLLRFGGVHVLGIAIPSHGGTVSSVFMLARGKAGHRFHDRDIELFEALAPHFTDAAEINRLLWLLVDRGASDADTLPVALLGRDGLFTQMTSGFARLFWPEEPPVSAYMPEWILTDLRKGRAVRLLDGEHSLYSRGDDSNGWRLRIRPSGPLDRLTRRELQIAGLFARGLSHKGIANEIGLQPATVRNHLRNIYEKLRISSRDELIALLDPA